MNLYLDIETVPCQQPWALSDIRASLKPPGTLKKADSIAAWWATEADSAADTAWRKQSLDGGTFGEIVSIALTTDSTCPATPEWVRCRAPGESEADLIREAFAVVKGWQAEVCKELTPGAKSWLPATFPVAHNAQFDLGFLWRRSRVFRIRTPEWLESPSVAKPGKHFHCTMHAWAGYGQYISLDKLCLALNIASPKTDMHGSQVFDAWLAGETNKIAAYNLADTKAVQAVYDVLQGVHP